MLAMMKTMEATISCWPWWPGPCQGNRGERIQMSRGTAAMRLIVMELGRFIYGFMWRDCGDLRALPITSILP